jgi:hypothetical protein
VLQYEKEKIISFMNQEELKKNYILLSRIAKEKKYAQEYLGLLARRGDIGSIRIGKRWYTTVDWFSEFELDVKSKKAEAKVAPQIQISAAQNASLLGGSHISSQVDENVSRKKIEVAEKIFETAKVALVMKKQEEKNIPAAAPVVEENRIKLSASVERKTRQAELTLKRNRRTEDGISAKRVEKRFPTIDLRKEIQPQEQRDAYSVVSERPAPSFFEAAKAGNDLEEAEREETVFSGGTEMFSPSFLPETKEGLPLFQKFAFGFSFVLLFFLIFQVALSLKGRGFGDGKVAGATDEKAENFSNIKFAADYYLKNQDSQMKENVSISQVALRAVLEKEKSSKELEQ